MSAPALFETSEPARRLAPPVPRSRFIRLTPVNRRRLAIFRQHRRGFWCFWIFLVLFGLSLFAELIANDRPLVMSYKGELLFPVFVDYPEEKFGGFAAHTEYRVKEISDEIEAHGWIVWPLIHFSYQTINYALPAPAPSPPTWMLSPQQCEKAAAAVIKPGSPNLGCRSIEWDWLGTDDEGRDVLARMIYGARVSILFGLALTLLSSVIGVAAGAVQGYFGGWTDLLFQRFIEIWSALPHLYILIIISSVIAPSVTVLLFILLLFSWVQLVHVVRAEFFRARNFEYIKAARALGLNNLTIMVKHVLPNATVATLTLLPFVLNGSITSLTALDFLGFGQPPGSPSLGELLLQGKSHTEAPWLGITGFVCIASILSLLIFIGEGVRDAFDPRKTLV